MTASKGVADSLIQDARTAFNQASEVDPDNKPMRWNSRLTLSATDQEGRGGPLLNSASGSPIERDAGQSANAGRRADDGSAIIPDSAANPSAPTAPQPVDYG